MKYRVQYQKRSMDWYTCHSDGTTSENEALYLLAFLRDLADTNPDQWRYIYLQRLTEPEWEPCDV